MKERDKYFKGQQSNETLICFSRHHWISLIREFLYFGIICGLIVLFFLNVNQIKSVIAANSGMKILFFTGFLVLTIFIHRFFIKLLNFFVNIEIITDLRLIEHHKSMFFIDTMDSIDMAQIQNIERCEEGILPTLFGYGNIKIFLNASSAIKVLQCMPNVQFHFRCIARLKEARDNMLRIATGLNGSQSIQNIDIDEPVHLREENLLTTKQPKRSFSEFLKRVLLRKHSALNTRETMVNKELEKDHT